MKQFINIELMSEKLVEILKNARNNFSGEEYEQYVMEEYSDEVIEERAEEMTFRFNEDMGKYLNAEDHAIYGNFNNIDYDYPYHINGEVEYDHELVQGMIDRLNAGDESERSNSDREWLVEWFFETFGKRGIEYNFSEEISEDVYLHFNE